MGTPASLPDTMALSLGSALDLSCCRPAVYPPWHRLHAPGHRRRSSHRSLSHWRDAPLLRSVPNSRRRGTDHTVAGGLGNKPDFHNHRPASPMAKTAGATDLPSHPESHPPWTWKLNSSLLSLCTSSYFPFNLPMPMRYDARDYLSISPCQKLIPGT